MKRSLKTSLSALAITAALSSSALASGGAFDFLDPCIKTRDDFSGQRQAVRALIDGAEASIPAMKATRSSGKPGRKPSARIADPISTR